MSARSAALALLPVLLLASPDAVARDRADTPKGTAGAETGYDAGMTREMDETAARAALPPAQRECLAKAVYFEARGEPEKAQAAVAAVVLNRVEDPQFPDTPCDVVRQGGETPPCQFSWWCDGRSDRPRDQDSWRQALRIADLVGSGTVEDPTGGALYFHHTRVSPSWSAVFEQVAEIGAHIYYSSGSRGRGRDGNG
ncbi:cell wall hydrolase [Rhodospirillum centenum]|uniref:Cell wall hydrolase n=1 Tax=Rhodospirillum centenum (strain ATCC 51521 / SW) TaxID=414684 RepID=B6ITN6_RHOCS|nr:cell wall hydrolase [Rhodospirillum centenum]ACI99337.1 cell wall hydrolase [Rhodospirillum centenum SW]